MSSPTYKDMSFSGMKIIGASKGISITSGDRTYRIEPGKETEVIPLNGSAKLSPVNENLLGAMCFVDDAGRSVFQTASSNPVPSNEAHVVSEVVEPKVVRLDASESPTRDQGAPGIQVHPTSTDSNSPFSNLTIKTSKGLVMSFNSHNSGSGPYNSQPMPKITPEYIRELEKNSKDGVIRISHNSYNSGKMAMDTEQCILLGTLMGLVTVCVVIVIS